MTIREAAEAISKEALENLEAYEETLLKAIEGMPNVPSGQSMLDLVFRTHVKMEIQGHESGNHEAKAIAAFQLAKVVIKYL